MLVVLADGDDEVSARDAYDRVLDALDECDYLPRELAFDQAFYVASAHEWADRYRQWIRDPVMQEMSRARTLFDLRPVHGRRSLWQQIDAAVDGARRSRLPPRAGQRLPGEPAAAHVLPGCRRRQRRRARLDLSARAQRAAAAGGRGPRLRDGGGQSHLAARRSSDSPRRARCCRSTRRSSAKRRTPSASCCGSRDVSASARARPAPSCRRRCSAATTVTCSRRASARFFGCSNSPRIANGCGQPVTEPPFVRRYRARFDADLERRHADRSRALRRARFRNHRAELRRRTASSRSARSR